MCWFLFQQEKRQKKGGIFAAGMSIADGF